MKFVENLKILTFFSFDCIESRKVNCKGEGTVFCYHFELQFWQIYSNFEQSAPSNMEIFYSENILFTGACLCKPVDMLGIPLIVVLLSLKRKPRNIFIYLHLVSNI